MANLVRNAKLAPVLLLALLAVGTGLQMACSTSEPDTGSSEDDIHGCGYGYNSYGQYGAKPCGYGYGYKR